MIYIDLVYGTRNVIVLITVFGAILTGRQSGQKLKCLYKSDGK